jgi:hypothetical protein
MMSDMNHPKPLTFLEASAVFTESIYRLGAEIARSLRWHALAEHWTSEAEAADERRRERRQAIEQEQT